MCDKFKSAFSKFAGCHTLYNGNYLDDDKIDELGMVWHRLCMVFTWRSFKFSDKNIKDFMSFYRTTFPHASILPKMHLMEEHMVPWIRQHHLGFGIMGEQGAESIHANFNEIEQSFNCMVHNRVERLLGVMKAHHLKISPANVALKPAVKKRKKNEDETTSHALP